MPSASTTIVEPSPPVTTSCFASSALCWTIGCKTLPRSCRTNASRSAGSGAFDSDITASESKAGNGEWSGTIISRTARRPGSPAQHVVKGERHRHAGVMAHQGDDVGDADMAERFDRAVVKPLRDPTRVRQTNRHLIDDLLALVGERGRQAAQHRLDLVGRQPHFLAAPLMRRGRVGRTPFAVDDDDGDFALAERIVAGVKMAAVRRRDLRQLRVVHPNLVGSAERPAGFDREPVALLLLGGHLVIGDFGVAAEGRRFGHVRSPCGRVQPRARA